MSAKVDVIVEAIDNIKSDRSETDVLYELLLKYGLDLAIPTETRTIEGSTVTVIGAGALIVCLAGDITLEVVSGIAALKDVLQPEIMRVVFKDSGFTDDVAKTNASQILRQAGIDDVKSLRNGDEEMSRDIIEYASLLEDIKARIRGAQTRAVLSANREMLALYREVGRLCSGVARSSRVGQLRRPPPTRPRALRRSGRRRVHGQAHTQWRLVCLAYESCRYPSGQGRPGPAP